MPIIFPVRRLLTSRVAVFGIKEAMRLNWRETLLFAHVQKCKYFVILEWFPQSSFKSVLSEPRPLGGNSFAPPHPPTVRQHLSRLPTIDPNTRTLLLCGYPNVGKSSFINKVGTIPLACFSLVDAHPSLLYSEASCLFFLWGGALCQAWETVRKMLSGPCPRWPVDAPSNAAKIRSHKLVGVSVLMVGFSWAGHQSWRGSAAVCFYHQVPVCWTHGLQVPALAGLCCRVA